MRLPGLTIGSVSLVGPNNSLQSIFGDYLRISMTSSFVFSSNTGRIQPIPFRGVVFFMGKFSSP